MYVGDIEVQVPLQKCRFWRPYNRDLTFLVPRIPWEFWYYMGLDWVFSRLYILLRILSSNAFWHFGLGKCKLMILRCRFHCKNTGFEDLTTLTFLVPRIPWEFWYYMGFDGFFLGCTFCCAFFPGMPLDILVLENVSWWYWGAGSTAKMQVLKTLQQGSYIFWFLGFPGNSGIIWVLIGFSLGCTFCCAFFPAMPLDILALENVCWWCWGAGSTAFAGFEDLTTGILHFLVPIDHQLTFSKTKMSKGIPGKNAQKNVQPRIPWEAVLWCSLGSECCRMVADICRHMIELYRNIIFGCNVL